MADCDLMNQLDLEASVIKLIQEQMRMGLEKHLVPIPIYPTSISFKIVVQGREADGFASILYCPVCLNDCPVTFLRGKSMPVCLEHGVGAKGFECKMHGRQMAEEKYNPTLGVHQGCSVCI